MSYSIKGRYPWLVGATSFVIPADIVTNVRHLCGKVDAVQLLFFESAANAALEHPVETTELKRIADEYGLSYTVHLPADVRLGSPDAKVRQAGVDEIARLVNELSVLSPKSYDLHVQREDHLPESQWLENVERSFSVLVDRLGAATGMIAIENTDFSFALVEELAADHGFSRCLDLGHILRHGHDLDDAWRAVEKARHIHYHGVENCKDHGAVTPSQTEITVALGKELSRTGYRGVVTLEVYSMADLDASLESLEKAWKTHAKE